MAQRRKMEQRARDPNGPGETPEELKERQAAAGTVIAADKILPVTRLELAEGQYNQYAVIVDHGTTLEDIQTPAYWANHTKALRPMDEIRVFCEDGSFVAYLLVQLVGTRDVKVAILSSHELDKVEPEAFDIPSGYNIDWGGALAKWRVLQGNNVLKADFHQRSHAQRWLSSHLQAMAR